MELMLCKLNCQIAKVPEAINTGRMDNGAGQRGKLCLSLNHTLSALCQHLDGGLFCRNRRNYGAPNTLDKTRQCVTPEDTVMRHGCIVRCNFSGKVVRYFATCVRRLLANKPPNPKHRMHLSFFAIYRLN